MYINYATAQQQYPTPTVQLPNWRFGPCTEEPRRCLVDSIACNVCSDNIADVVQI